MISGEHRDGDRLGQRRRTLAVHPAQPGPEALKGTQGAAGLGEHRLTLIGSRHRFNGRRRDRRDGLGQYGHSFSFWRRGSPEAPSWTTDYWPSV